jgi:hypothetical protein
MKRPITVKHRKPSAGSRIVASLKEAIDWVEGKDIRVRVTKMEVPRSNIGVQQSHGGNR